MVLTAELEPESHRDAGDVASVRAPGCRSRSGRGLLCLLIATHDFKLVERIDAIRPLTIAFSAAYLGLSLRFWFYGPAILTGIATACFTVATVLSA